MTEKIAFPLAEKNLRIAINGVGCFCLVPASNHRHNTAILAFFQPEGSDKPLQGSMMFRLKISADFIPAYIFDGFHKLGDQETFSAEQIATAQSLVDELSSRSPLTHAFQALSTAEMELEQIDRKLTELERRKDAIEEAVRAKQPSVTQDLARSARDEYFFAKDQFEERCGRLVNMVETVRYWLYHPNDRGDLAETIGESLKSDPEPQLNL